MKNTLTILIFLFSMAILFAQTPVRINIGDRQKITEFEVRNDSLVLSLENSGTNKVDLSGLADTGINWESATTKTLTLEDAGKIFSNNGATDFVYTIPTDASVTYGKDVAFTFTTESTGIITVVPESGATLVAGGSSVIAVTSNSVDKFFSIIRDGINNWKVKGAFNVLNCISDPNEQAIASNAASDPNCNETNATTGFLNSSVNIDATSDADSDTGDYAIKSTCVTAATVGFLAYRFAATAGDTFTVSFRAKSTQGTGVRITGWLNCTGGPSSVIPTSSYETYSYNITATATGNVELQWKAASGGTAVLGDNIFVDNLSIIKTN